MRWWVSAVASPSWKGNRSKATLPVDRSNTNAR